MPAAVATSIPHWFGTPFTKPDRSKVSKPMLVAAGPELAHARPSPFSLFDLNQSLGVAVVPNGYFGIREITPWPPSADSH
jgi:hypothetical protein